MLMMEVESDSGPEMWDTKYKPCGSLSQNSRNSSAESEGKVMSSAKIKKKTESVKRQKKRRKKKEESHSSSESDDENIERIMSDHGKYKTMQEERRYECEVCGKQLITKSHLRQHSYTHYQTSVQQPPNSIDEIQVDEIKIEPNITSSVNRKRQKWPCDGCQRQFSSESSLSRHRASFPGPHFFFCDICGAVYLKNETYLKHVAIKHPTPVAAQSFVQPLSCSTCGTVFSNSADLQDHTEKGQCEVSTALNEKPKYSCSLCGKEFISEEGLRYHESTQHRDKSKKKKNGVENSGAESNETLATQTFTCKICSAVVDSKIALQSHLKTHNVKKNMELRTGRYQCLICPRSFSSSDGLKYHLATHTGERRYGCSQCSRRFIKKTHLSEHIATHSNVKYFTCERCPRTFSTHSAYKKHIKMFPGPHNFFCSKCGKVFMKESMLERHLCVDLVAVALAPEVIAQLSEDMIEEYMCLAEEADREAGVQGQLSCYKCFKMFPSEDALHQHQHEHLGKQLYQCRFCPETFNRADAFSTHIANHLGSAPYMCRQCNRKFISPFTLATHLMNYPGEHSFTCQRCSRWFPSAERLDKHDCILQSADSFQCACSKQFTDWNQFLEHFGKKPFKCCACSQEFVTVMPLTRHIKRHTGARPFVCKVCGKSFLTRLNHQSHLKVHEESATLTCAMCDYKTKYQKRLDFHMMKRHEVVASTSTLCPVCGVLFPHIEQMRKHIEVDHGNAVAIDGEGSEGKKPLPSELCTLCGKMLTNKYSLSSHMKTVHSPTKSKATKGFHCEVCGETFRRANQLERHSEKHDEPGLQPCQVCNAMCNSRKDLRKHMRKHDNNKPFSCPRCGKRFKVAVSLKYHATICARGGRRKEPEPALQIPLYCELEPAVMTPVKWAF